MNVVASTLNPDLVELGAFAGFQLNLALNRLNAQGFELIALGTTMTARWWSGFRFMTHVLQTDDPNYIETMAMNWLTSDHKKSRFVGIVMDGAMTIEGNRTEALILRARTPDYSAGLMAYQPYIRATENTPSRLLQPIVDFPADLNVPSYGHDLVRERLLQAMFGKPS